jgi:hypothetical protein
MNIWQISSLIFALLGIATIIGMIWFVWAIFKGKIDLMGSGYEDAQREAKAKIKADLNEVNDPTVWLPEFAKTKNVKVMTSSHTAQYLPGGAWADPNIWVEVTNKTQEQLDEEKRVYFEAKEKRP